MPELNLDEVRAILAHPLENRPWRELVRSLLSEVDYLRARVASAERVCVIHGGLPPVDDSVRGKAALQAWLDWSHDYHRTAPDVSPQQEAALAQRRDEIRAATLARFRAERGGTDA